MKIVDGPSLKRKSAVCLDSLIRMRWPIDGPYIQYEETFGPIFDKLGALPEKRYENYFHQRLLQQRERLQSSHTLDLFGSGFFVPQEAVDSMTGVRLEPLVLTDAELKAGIKIPPQVLGNILEVSTWNRLDQSMLERSIQSFNLILMRPFGGWQNLPFRSPEGEARAMAFILEHAVQRLDENGEFYFHLHLMFATAKPLHRREEMRRLLSLLARRRLTLICADEQAANLVYMHTCVIRPIKL